MGWENDLITFQLKCHHLQEVLDVSLLGPPSLGFFISPRRSPAQCGCSLGETASHTTTRFNWPPPCPRHQSFGLVTMWLCVP